MSAPAALAVFAKAPLAGRVKTRLRDVLGPEGAAEFHLRCVQSIWERLMSLAGVDVFLYCDRNWPEFEQLAGPGRFRRQRDGDLGARMRACLNELLADGYRKALIVGSDAPTLPLSQIGEALSGLDLSLIHI